MFKCSRHSDSHKSGAQLPFVILIPVSYFRTIKTNGFKLFTLSTGKEIRHIPLNAHSKIAVLKRKFLLSMLHFVLVLHQIFKYWGTLYYNL